jgi:MFS family permease
VDPKARQKAYVASLSGTALEYYDFAVYSSAAALIFGQLFFAASDPLTGVLQAFGTYAIGYLARPLGGVFFGRLGDVIGRKKVLVATLLLVGVSTFLIGLLPTYGEIGPVAPALLVMLRFAQGIGVGGEWGGAVLLSSEYGSRDQRGFWASAAQVGPPIGTLLANGVIALLAVIMSEAAFLAWGWRVAFLLSAVLIGFSLWIRVKLEETPEFTALEARGERPQAPIREVLRNHRRALAAAMLARIGPDVLYSMFAVFVLTYATQRLGLTRGEALTAVLLGSAVQVPLIPLAGWLSDKLGRRRVYAVAAVAAAIWSFVFFRVASDASSLVFGVSVALVCHSFMYGPQAALISEQFAARVRYTGSSLAYTFAGIVGGAIAPLAFSWLLAQTRDPTPIAVYIGVANALTLGGLMLASSAPDQREPERATGA